MKQLEFYYGVMNSSKTAQLLMTRYGYLEKGKKVMVLKSEIDDRKGTTVYSRVFDDRVEATLIPKNVKGFIRSLFHYASVDCILVDEVQFLSAAQIEELEYVCRYYNINVLTYGLLTDFQGKLFEGSKRLIELGAQLHEVSADCTHCNAKAVFNMRIHNGVPVFEGSQIQVGGEESYSPVCPQCYADAKEDSQGVKEEQLLRE